MIFKLKYFFYYSLENVSILKESVKNKSLFYLFLIDRWGIDELKRLINEWIQPCIFNALNCSSSTSVIMKLPSGSCKITRLVPPEQKQNGEKKLKIFFLQKNVMMR